MFFQFLGGRAAHGYCRANCSRLLCQSTFHRTCRWPPSLFEEFRSVSILWNNPWLHNQMDTIHYLTQLTKLSADSSLRSPEARTPHQADRDMSHPSHGREKWLLEQPQTGVTEEYVPVQTTEVSKYFPVNKPTLKQKLSGRTVIFIFDFGF